MIESIIKTSSLLGSGWLGFPLAKQLLKNGYHIKISTTSENRLDELEAAQFEPFLIELEFLKDNLRSFLKSDILIINIPSKNVKAFRELINEIENSSISKILFVSSTSVYTDDCKTILESDGNELEDHPLVKIERLLTSINKVKTTVVRFGGLIGYDRNPGNFFKRGRVVQNPDAKVNLIHRDDCIEIICRIIEKQIWGEVFNCCADTHPTKRAFYSHAAKAVKTELPDFAVSEDNSYKIISNEKVKKYLNYQFKHPDLMKITF